jgi:predicted ArsR family transcriptional regulator
MAGGIKSVLTVLELMEMVMDCGCFTTRSEPRRIVTVARRLSFPQMGYRRPIPILVRFSLVQFVSRGSMAKPRMGRGQYAYVLGLVIEL